MKFGFLAGAAVQPPTLLRLCSTGTRPGYSIPKSSGNSAPFQTTLVTDYGFMQGILTYQARKFTPQ